MRGGGGCAVRDLRIPGVGGKHGVNRTPNYHKTRIGIGRLCFTWTSATTAIGTRIVVGFKEDPSHWPAQTYTSPVTPDPEIRVFINMVTPNALSLVERFSTYQKFLRVGAWIFRFIANLKIKHQNVRQKGPLTTNEIKNAEQYFHNQSQLTSFSQEILLIQKGSEIPRSSGLVNLRPFLDSNGILRVGGRISKAHLKYARRHPIILHPKERLTHLLVKHYHVQANHAGPTYLLSLLSRNFHIISARRLIRSICRSCITCLKQSAKTQTQIMGQLPMSRLTLHRN